MQNTLIDAGPIIALFNRDDIHHLAVKSFLRDFKGKLVTSWPVITETLYMLDFNHQAQCDFLKWIQYPFINILSVEKEHLDHISELMSKYHDVPMDFADASLVHAAELYKLTDILSLDNDFFVYRIDGKRKFNNRFKYIIS